MVTSVDYCGTYFVDEVNTLELSIQELVDYVLHRYLMRLTSLYFCEKIIKDTREKVQKVIREKRE